jgi:hypothetical protein
MLGTERPTRKANGSGSEDPRGYKRVPHRKKSVMEHVVVAEKILGRRLKHPEEIHHINEDKSDNRPANLVICPNRAYHMLLHQRTDAYDACGHADWLRCSYCKRYDARENMKFRPRGKDRPGQVQWCHPQCARDYANARTARKSGVNYRPRRRLYGREANAIPHERRIDVKSERCNP